jgi:23S rRNA pseudouridine2604 synthase
VATLGVQVAAGDVVCVDGRPVAGEQQHVYLALNKPVGVISTTERTCPATSWTWSSTRAHLPIGRLDKDSEGLILLTNNGDIVNEILRSENEHEKEYVVTVDRPVTEIFLGGMAERRAHPRDRSPSRARCSAVGAATFRIVLTQGLNRQIRRMCSFFGYKVLRLQRVRIINIALGGPAAGPVAAPAARRSRGAAADKPDFKF